MGQWDLPEDNRERRPGGAPPGGGARARVIGATADRQRGSFAHAVLGDRCRQRHRPGSLGIRDRRAVERSGEKA